MISRRKKIKRDRTMKKYTTRNDMALVHHINGWIYVRRG